MRTFSVLVFGLSELSITYHPMRKLFRTKVCGIKTTSDFEAARDSGVEAIGLNFVVESPRFLPPQLAVEMLANVRAESGSRRSLSQPCLVGVFVNPTPDYVRQILRVVPLAYVQLHGEELADHWRGFEDVPLIKAVRWSGDVDQRIYLTGWHQMLGDRLAAFLVDAPSSDVRGGSGMKADWNSLMPRPAILAGKPLILAGGLTPENVEQAIQEVQPTAVDTASGVESAPGKKEAAKMQNFVRNSTRAWQLLKT